MKGPAAREPVSSSAALAPGCACAGNIRTQPPALLDPGAGRVCRPQAEVSCVGKATCGGPCGALFLSSSIRAHSPRSLGQR